MPLVSIIVPVYNSENYIEKCTSSLMNQTYQELEIVLVNDGSTDKSLEICRKLAELDSRVVVYDKKNEGPGFTREFGINNSNGEYIMFVDSDDYIDPNTIESMINCMVIDNVDLVRCNVVIESNNIKRKMWQPPFCGKVIEKEEIVNNIIPLLIAPENEANYNSRLHRGCVCSLFKRELISKGNLHFTSLTGGEDALFTMGLFLTADKIEFVPDYFYHYEQSNEESLSKKLEASNREQRIQKKEYIKEMTKSFSCYSTIEERWKQEDRRMVYLDSRLIVHTKDKSLVNKIKMLRSLLADSDTIKAFDMPINKELPFQMYVLYALIKYRLAIMLYFAIIIKRV